MNLDHVPFEWIDQVFRVMFSCPQHTFLILTKRPGRMSEYLKQDRPIVEGKTYCWNNYPLSNVWLGVSCEDQKTADERIPILLQISAAHYFISHEPGLGMISYPKEFLALGNNGWLITGGETGPKARPMHPDIPWHDRDQSQMARIPFFFKSWGEWAWSESAEMKKYKRFEQFKLHRFEDGTCMYRIGKKKAGRLLDGREWSEFPK